MSSNNCNTFVHRLSLRAKGDHSWPRHKRPNEVRESLTYENISEILTSTSAPEHKSSLGGMPVLGNAASQKTGVEFLPHDYPPMILCFWPQQPRLVCEELCCFSLPLGLCQIIARSWEKIVIKIWCCQFYFIESASRIWYMASEPTARPPLFFFKIP